ncbi:peptidoglycan-binding domain-containing protein [Brachybacterium sp.]|uniref:N-acetylmuramoyl-L-alanine amidase n=1 Tax=Brachybacterium sp. TaxID=1891286 RepID=UPI002ED22BDF
MPGASRVQTFSGNRHKRPITKIVLHTTEGSSWPGYNGGGSAPHFTVHRDGTIRQHINTDYSAKALVNRSGGVETNNGGVVQIEFIGSCDRSWARKHGLFFTENATDRDLAGLARVLAWISKTHGVPLTATGLRWPTSNAAYATAPQRFSYAEWNRYRGICGHTHVPENDHWDPGAFPVARLLRLAGGASIPIGGGAGVPQPSVKPDPKRPWITSPRVKGMSKAEVREIQHVLAGFDLDLGKYGVDGSYGDATGTAVQTLQRELHITPTDGIYGPGTEKAVMTIREDINKLTRTLEPGIKNKRTDGEFASFIRDQRNILRGDIAQSRAAIIKAVQETGKAQGLTDAQVQKVAQAAAEAAASVSAEDVAGLLDVTVKG